MVNFPNLSCAVFICYTCKHNSHHNYLLKIVYWFFWGDLFNFSSFMWKALVKQIFTLMIMQTYLVIWKFHVVRQRSYGFLDVSVHQLDVYFETFHSFRWNTWLELTSDKYMETFSGALFSDAAWCDSHIKKSSTETFNGSIDKY